MANPLQSLIRLLQSSPARKTVTENFLSLTLLQLVTSLVPFLTVPYLLRVIGPAKYGLIAFAQAFVGYFALLADYGFNYSALREISISKEDPAKVSRIFSAVLTVKICFLILALIFIGTLCVTVPKFRDDWPVYIASSGFLIGYFLFSSFLFQALEKMKYILLLNLPSLIFTLLVFVWVKSEKDFLRVPLLSSAGAVTVGILGLWTAFRKLGVRWQTPTWDQIRHELKEGWGMFLCNLAAVGHGNVRIFAVGLFAGNRITGYYAVAERLMNLLQVFPLSLFIQTVYPRLCAISRQNKEKFQSIITACQSVTVLFYLAAALLCIFFAPAIITLVAGAPFQEAIWGFRLLTVALFLTAINAFRVQFFLVLGRRDLIARIGIITGGLGTLLCFPLTYYFSYAGAAASLIALLLLALGMTLQEKARHSEGEARRI